MGYYGNSTSSSSLASAICPKGFCRNITHWLWKDLIASVNRSNLAGVLCPKGFCDFNAHQKTEYLLHPTAVIEVHIFVTLIERAPFVELARKVTQPTIAQCHSLANQMTCAIRVADLYSNGASSSDYTLLSCDILQHILHLRTTEWCGVLHASGGHTQTECGELY